MTITYVSGGANNVLDQVQKFWSPMFMDELRESAVLPALVNRDYEGEIKRQGDSVRVSQVMRPAATRKSIPSGDNTFTSAPLVTKYVDLKCDQRITASFELEDLVDLQSQLGSENSKIRDALIAAALKDLNDYLYTFVAPTLTIPSIATLTSTELIQARKEAAKARWLKEKGWYGLLNPHYYSNLLAAQTLTSSDFVGGEQPVVGGQLVNKRYGFNLIEDNTDGIETLSVIEGAGLFFHPDFLLMAMQRQPTFQLSSTHVLNKHGYILSVDFVVGAKLGIDGADKHILVKADA